MSEAGEVRLVREVVVDAARQAVWARVTTPEGIDHELRPLLSMRMPARHAGATIGTVPVGERLGRAWLRLGGVLPVEYDDLVLVAVDPPAGFHERSSMATARVWEHRRRLEELPDGRTRVVDELRMVPRVPLPAPALGLVRRLVDALFAHRHRRLQGHFARGPEPAAVALE